MNKYTSAYINRQNFSKDEVTINSCGNYVINQENFVTYRECGTNDYQLIYLHSGQIINNINGNSYNHQSVLLFYPETKHNYTYVANKNTDVFWIHFGGKKVREMLEKYNINENITYDFQHSFVELSKYFLNIIREITIGNSFFQDVCVSEFTKILIELSRCASSPINKNASSRKFQKAIEMMYMNTSDFSLKRYADLYCLSVSRFSHLFKEAVGMSPHAFHLEILANKAKDLVINSDLNISEIADILGFSDIYYFSRFYKKVFGVSPNKHR